MIERDSLYDGAAIGIFPFLSIFVILFILIRSIPSHLESKNGFQRTYSLALASVTVADRFLRNKSILLSARATSVRVSFERCFLEGAY